MKTVYIITLMAVGFAGGCLVTGSWAEKQIRKQAEEYSTYHQKTIHALILNCNDLNQILKMTKAEYEARIKALQTSCK